VEPLPPGSAVEDRRPSVPRALEDVPLVPPFGSPFVAAGREFVRAVSGEDVNARWQRRFDVSCRLLLSWGDGEGSVMLAFGSEEGAREAESRFLNRVPLPEQAIEPMTVQEWTMGRDLPPPAPNAEGIVGPIRQD
jgi:hypothetical protein